MMLIYNIFQLLCLALGFPFWIFLLLKKQKYRHKLCERLCFSFPPHSLSKLDKSKKRVIIHGVSVGEVNAALPLVQHFLLKKGYQPVLTTTTHTGYHSATHKPVPYPVFYFPLDFLFSVKRFLNKTQPSAIIILETEIWPNLYFEAKKRNIPVIVINARLSEESYKGYHLFRFFFKRVLRCASFFGVQTQEDQDKLLSLGVEKAIISVTGNLKFMSAIQNKEHLSLSTAAALQAYKLHPLFIAGSTHPGEEEIILSAWKEASDKFRGLHLILAPRHIERIPDIENLLSAKSFPYSLLSHIKENKEAPSKIILVDTIGDLFFLYSLSDIVFIGKSLLSPGGGQNMIEPAVWGKPVIFGPYVKNFLNIANSMIQANAAIMVQNKEELKEKLILILSDETKKKLYSDNAFLFVNKNTEVIPKSIAIIDEILENI